MKPLSNSFTTAGHDYVYLLERSYPAKTVLSLVATRYSLSAAERSMLYRGVSPSAEAKKRKAKKTTSEKSSNNATIHVDTLNVLLTIHTYLAGKPVFISSDGFLRDASEAHGNKDLPHLERSVTLLISFLDKKETGKCIFYLDEKADNSPAVKNSLEPFLSSAGYNSEIITNNMTDRMIEQARDGVIATSDSTIIDRSPLPVVDLPEETLRYHFDPVFISLQDIFYLCTTIVQ